ncbi:nitrogen fixation protein NifQ [Azospirillum sp. RWY-5-1]|uniref:Nitrogen fixation protein NifQ n=1 Tax=Azospirillum oleiclasticum TaxID=2735135 RepID=A0ABX2T6Z8_9PROT|nr:nitrogen fixation protein NifQ [Azospirillum oleiclasticum]NYZ13226.1 nitrogen fixation protein NifQ [Azospirillum oleiclasticum]NYZ20102.1 nitrogen fixation protein NifQ [Azospirillum oleiclasticum]
MDMHMPAQPHGPDALYRWLTSHQTRCNVVDAHLFACILARRWPAGRDAGEPDPLGLDTAGLIALMGRYFPMALCDRRHTPGPTHRSLPALLAAEAADLADILLEHRSVGVEEEAWLAAMVARACLDDGPLWRDLGLTGRRQLTAMFERHFEPLAARNRSGTRWRTMLYRLLCARDGLLACRVADCDGCAAGTVCFGAEG